MRVAVVIACLVAALAQAPRWLRVAQREHYLPGATTRFAARWWRCRPENVALLVASVATAVLAAFAPVIGLTTALVTVVAPIGLSLRGRTSRLAWTRRLETLAAVVGVVDVGLFAAAAFAPGGAAVAAFLCLAQPLVLDLGLVVTRPFERAGAQRYVRTAEAKLRAVHPVTVAITGSYGKTTTKVYLRHLAAGARSVLASPASFNNTGGLSRTLNEHLVPGTEVFIAEMGTYGPGEIRDLCAWVRPDVAAIVNIGPVHLERMGSLDGIVAAKAEIFSQDATRTAVLNVDAHGLAHLADQLQVGGRRVIRVSTTDREADVAVVPAEVPGQLEVLVAGEARHRVAATAPPANVAAALGIVVALDLPLDVVLPRLDTLPQSEHRQQVVVSPTGITVIDNTFSSNPASAATSLALLRDHTKPDRRAVVVTPGMVELGAVEDEENERFGAAIAGVATDLLVVGRTNRRALRRGAAGRGRGLAVLDVDTRDEAVAWVRSNLREGDAVLYENDLPDHFP